MLKLPGRCLLLASFVAAAGCTPTVSTTPASAPSRTAETSSQPRASLLSSPDDPNAVTVASSVRKVTVYSDRALVSREGPVKLGGGPTVYAFRHLPGWVDEGSVRVAASSGRILDVRVVRSYLARSTEKGYVAADSSLHELSGRLAALDDELTVLDAQAKQVENIRAFSVERLNADTDSSKIGARAGSVGVETYAAVVDFIGAKLRAVARGRRSAQAEREKLEPEVAAAKKRLDDFRPSRRRRPSECPSSRR